jgi:hypothetical protein
MKALATGSLGNIGISLSSGRIGLADTAEEKFHIHCAPAGFV